MYYMYKHKHGHKIRYERQEYVLNAMTEWITFAYQHRIFVWNSNNKCEFSNQMWSCHLSYSDPKRWAWSLHCKKSLSYGLKVWHPKYWKHWVVLPFVVSCLHVSLKPSDMREVKERNDHWEMNIFHILNLSMVTVQIETG